MYICLYMHSKRKGRATSYLRRTTKLGDVFLDRLLGLILSRTTQHHVATYAATHSAWHTATFPINMYAHKYIYIHTYTYICVMYTYTRIYIYIYVHTCMCIFLFIFIFTYSYIFTNIHMHMYTYRSMCTHSSLPRACAHASVFVSIFTDLFLYIYTDLSKRTNLLLHIEIYVYTPIVYSRTHPRTQASGFASPASTPAWWLQQEEASAPKNFW